MKNYSYNSGTFITKGRTIVTRRLRGTCWDLELAMGVAGDGGETIGSHDVAM